MQLAALTVMAIAPPFPVASLFSKNEVATAITELAEPTTTFTAPPPPE